MKYKLFIFAILASLAFSSCKRQQCPAYGKINTKTSNVKPC